MDKGSETGYIYANQTGLWEAYAPELDTEKFPPMLQMKSVHNTPIEGLWHWFLQTFGLNIKDVIRQGLQTGVYHPNNSVHQQLFNWLWPKMLQIQLDAFVKYWNNHCIRTQKNKPNMSGLTLRHAFTVPAPPTQDCRIPVNRQVISTLCSQIPVTCEEAMRWVDDAFDGVATRAYEAIGSPPLNKFLTGWDIFSTMVGIINAASTSM
ncbi:hypothetical protein CPB84DRAFT_1843672 [Gymnopilus junonius]|uniref:Integrase core domain-containing protein n=1 Tax=Gymnopilus junonius TaxID=109634 RepID=A0A9P5NXZ0_GYMJU|nr:hypothetical protein CPB84DRAFT_1843672 [Gymnopilus junonius]